MIKRFLSGLLITLCFIAPATYSTGSTQFEYDAALKLSQAAIGNKIGDYSFSDSLGDKLPFSTFQGKPLVLSMIFTSCFQICPMTTRHLAKVVEKARAALGDNSFSVVIIGFDTEVDTPQAMQYFANKQGFGDIGWNLLSIPKHDITALSRDLGFSYYPSSNGFDHLIQTTIIDAQGLVFRQIYGQVFDTPLLVEPLKDLILGRPQASSSFISDLNRKIKLFCTTYDPVRDGYFFDYSLFLGMLIGGFIIIFTAFFMWSELNKQK